jgi:hypothetical protein
MTTETTGNTSAEDLPERGQQEVPAIDDSAAAAATLREKLTDAQTPGYQAEFDPEEAVRAGAFFEDALSEADAAGSSDDLSAALAQLDQGGRYGG